jgi:hypothetical protein
MSCGTIVVFPLSHTRSPVHVPLAHLNTHMHSILRMFLQTPVSGEGEKGRIQERISGLCLWLFTLFDVCLLCSAARSCGLPFNHEKNGQE